MRSKYAFFLMCALAAAILVAGCAKIDPIEPPALDTGSADFTRLAVIGTSISAGYQNGGLAESRQVNSHAALLAVQLGKQRLTSAVATAQTGEFVIPGYGDPGSAGTLQLTSLVPATIEPVTIPGAPLNTTYPAPYNCIAVPGATVNSAMNTVVSASNPFYTLVLRGQGTMLQMVGALQPTFVLVELGCNEVLGAVTGDVTPPAVSAFEAEYTQLVNTLLGLATTPKLVLYNIPDVQTIPFATTVPPVVVNPATNQPVLVNGAPVPLIGPDGPLALTDLVTLGAISLMRAGQGIPVALGGTGVPLPDVVVINASELTLIVERTNEFNEVIEAVAAQHGLPIADLRGLRHEASGEGIPVGGLDYTSEFVTGGLLGLDGIHPTDMGNALLANLTIRAINEAYGASIPLVDLRKLAGVSAGGGGGIVMPLDSITDAMIESLMRSPVCGAIGP